MTGADAPPTWIVPDWSAPDCVHALVTTRDGPAFALLSHTYERLPSGVIPAKGGIHVDFPGNTLDPGLRRDDEPWIAHATRVRGFNVGLRCGDDPAAVAGNRAFLRDALELPAEPCWLYQVHGTQAAVEPRPGEPEADAAVSRTPGVVLAIQTADCLPVLFCNDDGTEVAAAHAGWRGLSAGVLEATLTAMRTRREHVLAWLGPAIAAASYEVGDEVRDAFLAHELAAASAFAKTRPGHWLCDLYALAQQRLRAAGVARIFGGGLDTFTDSRLHSWRRDGARSGRMASLIWLAP